MTECFNFSTFTFLLVDDSKGMCLMVRHSLISLGAKAIFTVSTGSEALAFMKRPEVDVALIDYQLGETDPLCGLDLVRACRRMPDPMRRRPLIFFTAYSDQETVLAARDAGVDDVIAKPFTIGALHNKLISVLSTPRPFIVSDDYVGPSRQMIVPEMPIVHRPIISPSYIEAHK